MIKVLFFFVLGVATLYFIIRALVNTEPGKLSRVIKIIIISLVLLLAAYFVIRNPGFLMSIIGIVRGFLGGL